MDLDPHLSKACSSLVRQDFMNTTSIQQSDSLWPIFSFPLWYLTNICGLHDLVIPPQWAPFGFGSLVAPFGVYTHSHTYTHTCTLVNNHSCLVDMLTFHCGLSFLALLYSIMTDYVEFVLPKCNGCRYILKNSLTYWEINLFSFLPRVTIGEKSDTTLMPVQ